MASDIVNKIFGGIRHDERKKRRENMRALTVWVPAETKAEYIRVQKETEKEFGKRLPDWIAEALSHFPKKAG